MVLIYTHTHTLTRTRTHARARTRTHTHTCVRIGLTVVLRMWMDPTAEFLWSQHSTEGSHSDAEAPIESLLFKVQKR